ncbi:MAG: lysogenization regulator HflD [Gammaproteobacteria bacterium HGW-Gammaproteobacteria-14]|nr:MAG: lysogenization regulator HflD [Gammaproteobacteria bacterium HGW-Gammaproteobacteria-14]
MASDREQMMALAAIFQSALLADQLATTGQCNRRNMAPLFQAVLTLDATDYQDIYPNPSELRPGLTLLRNALSGQQQPSDLRAIGHALALIQLSGALRRDNALINILRNRLEVVSATRDAASDPADPEVCRRLGGIYVDTLSTLKFRIRVQGEPEHLQNEDNAATIRALFLAGVRAAFLWHQGGGRRWHMLLRRQRLLKATQSLLAH